MGKGQDMHEINQEKERSINVIGHDVTAANSAVAASVLNSEDATSLFVEQPQSLDGKAALGDGHNHTASFETMPFWKDFVAGNIGGMCGILAGHPFDTLKVRIQTQPQKYNGDIFNTLYRIVKNEGVHGLYKGLASPLFGVGILNSIIFGVYGNTMRALDEYRGRNRGVITSDFLYYGDVFIAGSFAGLVNCPICSPLELVKTRLQIQDQSKLEMTKRYYTGPLDCFIKTWKSNGIRGIYKGFNSTLVRDVPSYGAYFVMYEYLKERYGEDPLALFLSGGFAGIGCWYLSYWADAIKSRIQALPDPPQVGHDKYKGFIDCCIKSYKAEGYMVFFRGLNSSIVRAFPLNAVTFLAYETAMKIL
ncbi:hypothetical protein FDP41_005436 [Naegleria fowleri]|uniref:Mitochondrial carrier protein n=1 Tax=Naegleria fowleri TaxID=5763 RepID=A0A6A5BKN7_NAEFO|nr:uncharacterized protein FDP41_005436 [Naegleria fowleri]KAF0975442.1 hypothetical protein FDP41_005436 [Naegleria fowleri]CAG4715527.1 unnamed protein product [Naegleria fowleri]